MREGAFRLKRVPSFTSHACHRLLISQEELTEAKHHLNTTFALHFDGKAQPNISNTIKDINNEEEGAG